MAACKNVNFPQYIHSVNLIFYVNEHRCNNLRDLNVKKEEEENEFEFLDFAIVTIRGNNA